MKEGLWNENAYELRLKERAGIYRIIYVLHLRDKVCIPHAFNKKTQKTPQKEIILAIKRLREIL
jgi:phage-related protein